MIKLNVLFKKKKKIFVVFDCEEGGPSLTATIPGVCIRLGLCLGEAPDLMGAMSPCPSKNSLCPDKLSSIIRQEDILEYISNFMFLVQLSDII